MQHKQPLTNSIVICIPICCLKWISGYFEVKNTDSKVRVTDSVATLTVANVEYHELSLIQLIFL